MDTDGGGVARRSPAAFLIVAALCGMVLLLLWLGLWPLGQEDLQARPQPVVEYDTAVNRFRQIRVAERAYVDQASASLLLTHGFKTARAYILVHGITNSPLQWQELGRILFDLGHNVLILRMPYHGMLSHHVAELKPITAGHLRAYADLAVDIGAGMGDELVVAGISGGATVAAWMAQNRSEVERCLLLAPFFGIHRIPEPLTAILGNAFSRIPNVVFHSPHERERAWAYRGEATRGIAAFLVLGKQVLRQGRAGLAPVGPVATLTTAVEDTANNATTTALLDLWRQNGTAAQALEFPVELAIPHNSIDPGTNPFKKAVVYAAMLRLFGELETQLPV